MAHVAGAPADPGLVHSGMNYGYYLKYRSALLRRPQGDVPFEPAGPMLFLYGRKKPTMFHSEAFVERLNRTPGSRAVGFDAGHWLMLELPDEVAGEIRDWTRAATSHEQPVIRQQAQWEPRSEQGLPRRHRHSAPGTAL
jgi:pimeloyl-ACP methyl ester carboxylesterase